MKVLIFFSFFLLFLFAEADIGYDAYRNFAEKKEWPNTAEAFKAYTDYCNGQSSTTPELLPELTYNDCDTSLTPTDVSPTKTPGILLSDAGGDQKFETIPASFHLTLEENSLPCPATTVTSSTTKTTSEKPSAKITTETTSGQITTSTEISTTSKAKSTSENNFATSTKNSATSAQNVTIAASFLLTVEDSKLPCSESPITTFSTDTSFQKTSKSSTKLSSPKPDFESTLMQNRLSTLSDNFDRTTENFATKVATKTVTHDLSSSHKTYTSLSTVPLPKTSATVESPRTKTSISKFDVSSSLESTRLTKSTSTVASTKESITTATKKTARQQTATSVGLKISTTTPKSLPTKKSTESHVSDTTVTMLQKSTNVPLLPETTETLLTTKIHKSTGTSTVLTKASTKPYIVERTTLEPASSTRRRTHTSIRFSDGTFSSDTSTAAPSSTPSTTKANEEKTSTAIDLTHAMSTTPVSTASDRAPILTESARHSSTLTNSEITKMNTEKELEGTLDNEITKSKPFLTRSTDFKAMTSTVSVNTDIASSSGDLREIKTSSTTVSSTPELSVPDTVKTSSSTIQSTMEMSTTKTPEDETTKASVITTPLPETSFATTMKTINKHQTETTTTTSVPELTDNHDETSTAVSISTSEATTTSTPLTERSATKFSNGTYTSSVKHTLKIQPTTVKETPTEQTTTKAEHVFPKTTRTVNVEQKTPSIKPSPEATLTTSTATSTTVSPGTVTLTKPSNFVETTAAHSTSLKTTTTSSTKESDVATTTVLKSTSKPTSTTFQTNSASDTSTPALQPNSESSASTTSTTESPPTTSATEASLPTKEPRDCTMPCPDEFFEGDYACFKFIQPKDGKAWKNSDFKTACDSMDGIVASFGDFEYVKNMELFKKIALSKKINVTSVLINTVPTPNIAARRVINGIDLTKSNSTKISTIQLPSGKKYTNSTAVCRVGKFCEEYTCPIREFFMVESARYFETAAPLTKVLKAGDSLNVECVGNPKKTFQLECDRRGYLIPDSSMLKCEGSGIKSEAVKSCAECDIQHTESCQDLKNGSFSCNCKQSYFGQTCKNIVDACTNYTCKNGGTCINEFLNAKCKCQTSHFGDRCQYDFYKSEGPARVMRALTNAAVVIVIIDEVVRTRQKYIIPAAGKTGTLPTEVCRFYTTMMGAMAFIMKLLYEFPDSGKMEEKYYCQTHFEITITFVFLSLSGMLAESVISLGVITNNWTNQFKGRCKDRKNCISTGKLFILISTIAIIPTAIIWKNSSLLVTPHSCIGTLPWENASDQKQMAGMLLVVLMTFYATTASAIALFARQFLDQNNLETRRRYDCDRTNPFAYGREILPIENNVRYYLLALRPILFALNWFCLIASTELMVEWVSGLSTVVGLTYSVVNFLQNNFAFKKDLEGWIYTAMGWLPKEYSPKMNKVSLHSRKDYLRIHDPEALEAEEAKLIEQRDLYLRSKYPIDRDFEEAKVAWTAAAEVRYPIVYEQQIEHLMLADRNRWLNATALRIMMPAGLRAVIKKQWALIYLRARAAGRTRSGAMAAIFKQLQPPRLFTYGYRRSIFVGMYRVFWENMTIVDQLDGVKDVDREKVIEVFQRGVQMLTIKPNRKIELAEIWDPEHSDGRTSTFKRNDPLMNIDQQQKVFDMLEELCNSITSEMMEQDEAISRALFEGDPERYGIRQDILTENVFNDYPTSLMDFMLNEQRPNFIGPRTIENVLAPGVNHLQHTAWFWMIHNGLMWQRVTTQAKYLAFFVQIKKDNAEIYKNNNSWRNYWPWNWFNKNENVQQQANPEPEDDLHVEDPIGLN